MLYRLAKLLDGITGGDCVEVTVPYTINRGTNIRTVLIGMAKFTPDDIPEPAHMRTFSQTLVHPQTLHPKKNFKNPLSSYTPLNSHSNYPFC